MEPILFQMNPLEPATKFLQLREAKVENLSMTTSHEDDSSPQVEEIRGCNQTKIAYLHPSQLLSS